MPNLDKIAGGIGLLIFAYLLFSQGAGANAVFKSLGSTSVSLIRALQGRD